MIGEGDRLVHYRALGNIKGHCRSHGDKSHTR
jgi:hypothetical protein